MLLVTIPVAIALFSAIGITAYLCSGKSEKYTKGNFIKKISFKAKNFIRPVRVTNPLFFEFANKYCVVRFYCQSIYDDELHSYQISYRSKNDVKEYTWYSYDTKEFINIIDLIINYFNFDTKCDDLTKMLTVHDVELNCSYVERYVKSDLNCISVAELISLPGINMGKAYKIKKYLSKHYFQNTQDFIKYADISEADAQIIKRVYPKLCTVKKRKKKI